MKKLLLLGITVCMMLPLEAPVEAAVVKSAKSELKASYPFKRKKSRGYRKKKGFMWGLFRGKIPVVVPNINFPYRKLYL